MKLGIYADGSNKSMIIFAELYDDIERWESDYMIPMTDTVKNEYDYYTKVHKKPLNVHKFQFNLYPYVNGIRQKNSKYFWQDNDQ